MNKTKLPPWFFEGMQKKKYNRIGLINQIAIKNCVVKTFCGISWRHKPTVCLTKLCRHTLRFLNMHFRHKNQGWLKKTVKN